MTVVAAGLLSDDNTAAAVPLLSLSVKVALVSRYVSPVLLTAVSGKVTVPCDVFSPTWASLPPTEQAMSGL